MKCTVFYDSWQMECCGTPFSVGDIVKWLVLKAEQLNTPVNVGAINYCYEAHSSDWQNIFVLEGKVETIKILYHSYLHDFGFEILHSRVCAAVLAPGFGVRWSVHVGQQGYFLNPQGIDNDMHMNIAAVVVSVRVGAYQGLVSGEMRLTKSLAQFLRPVYGQSVVRPVPWVKGNDVVMAFHIFPLLVFAVPQIGAHTGNGKILAAAVQRCYSVIVPRHKPPAFIKRGAHGKLVMLKG